MMDEIVYLLMHIQDLFAIQEKGYFETIPKQYRSSLKNIEVTINPSPNEYFANIIFRGEIPIGTIVYRLISNIDNIHISYELEVCYIKLVDHLVSIKAVEDIEDILKTIPAFLVRFNIKLIRCSISDNNLLFDYLRTQLLKNNWLCCGSFKLNEYDPFRNSMQWKIKLRQLELIYFRTLKQRDIKILSFDLLNADQRHILKNIDAPNWSNPFNPSLFSAADSKFSYVIFRKETPLSWVISDKPDSNSLFVETSWFNPSICSSAKVFSLFYLIFKDTFGWNGVTGQNAFSFRFLTNNNHMHNLDEWLTPFLERSCLCQQYDLPIELI